MARSTRHPPPTNPVEELIALAADLDLTTLAEIIGELLTRAEKEDMSYSDFALAMLRAEANARRERRLERGLKRSRLGASEGLDGFNVEARPQLDPKVVKELLNCRFALERRNILCLGRSGLGKTRVLKAIGHAACVLGYSTLFVMAAEMLEELHASQADGSFHRALRRYTKPAVLLVDEFGIEPFDAEATTYLYRLIAARHQQGSIVLAANTGFSKWKALFPSEPTALATVDRLIDRATILRFTGKSFRDPQETTGAPLDE
jgi:DNA replication protein DnaC